MLNYEAIKHLAKPARCRVNDLIALAPQNDPFYVGTEGDRAWGEWFADIWRRFGYRSGVHLRRIHYQVVSQDPPVVMPDGQVHENTEACWAKLAAASKKARYLDLVDADDFDDRRNPEALLPDPDARDPLLLHIADNLYGAEVALPTFPEPPAYWVSGYNGRQPYHIELWCEKSTMNDILEPLCRRYRAGLQIGVGELSITKTLRLVQRIANTGKPTRIFYISDFDPAGTSMPVAVARKIEYFIHKQGLDLDVRLFPVVLTEEQVRHYQLPRTPIKETERRRDSFEERFGEGATELDALEALQPGELRRILVEHIEGYYDTGLERRVREAREALQADLDDTRQAIIDRHQPAIDELKAEYDRLRAEVEAKMAVYNERLGELWQSH